MRSKAGFRVTARVTHFPHVPFRVSFVLKSTLKRSQFCPLNTLEKRAILPQVLFYHQKQNSTLDLNNPIYFKVAPLTIIRETTDLNKKVLLKKIKLSQILSLWYLQQKLLKSIRIQKGLTQVTGVPAVHNTHPHTQFTKSPVCLALQQYYFFSHPSITEITAQKSPAWVTHTMY